MDDLYMHKLIMLPTPPTIMTRQNTTQLTNTLNTLIIKCDRPKREKRKSLFTTLVTYIYTPECYFLARFSIWKLMQFWMSSVPVWSYRRCGIRYSFEGRDRLQSCAFKGQNPALHLTIFGLDDGWPRQWRSGFSIVSRMIFFCFKSTD